MDDKQNRRGDEYWDAGQRAAFAEVVKSLPDMRVTFMGIEGHVFRDDEFGQGTAIAVLEDRNARTADVSIPPQGRAEVTIKGSYYR